MYSFANHCTNINWVKKICLFETATWAFVVISTQNHRIINLFNIIKILNKYKIFQDHRIRKFSNNIDLSHSILGIRSVQLTRICHRIKSNQQRFWHDYRCYIAAGWIEVSHLPQSLVWLLGFGGYQSLLFFFQYCRHHWDQTNTIQRLEMGLKFRIYHLPWILYNSSFHLHLW